MIEPTMGGKIVSHWRLTLEAYARNEVVCDRDSVKEALAEIDLLQRQVQSLGLAVDLYAQLYREETKRRIELVSLFTEGAAE